MISFWYSTSTTYVNNTLGRLPEVEIIKISKYIVTWFRLQNLWVWFFHSPIYKLYETVKLILEQNLGNLGLFRYVRFSIICVPLLY